MKQNFFLYVTLLLFALALSGCGGDTKAASPGPVDENPAPASEDVGVSEPSSLEKELVRRQFTLKSADGVDFTRKERRPTIEFSEDLRVAGSVCNRLVGQASFEGSKLFIRNIASTKMMCPDHDLNRLENRFAEMFDTGFDVQLEGKTLKLTQEGHDLVYERLDWAR